jgi:hypothetical protein
LTHDYGKLRNRRAVSTIVAVMLMIAIAVAASVLVYVWSMTLVGSLQMVGGRQVREQMELDAYTWQFDQPLVLRLRNVGPTPLVVDVIYIEGTTITGPGLFWTINVGTMKEISLTIPTSISLVRYVEYSIKIVTQAGGVFSFPCMYGRGR